MGLPYAQAAEDVRLLFMAGIARPQDVVAWADSILAEHEYNEEIATLSLSSGILPQETNSILRRLGDGSDPYVAIRRLCGRMHEELLRDRNRARDFARILESLWVECAYDIPEDLTFMAGIDDYFSLAAQGIIFSNPDDAADYLIWQTARFHHKPIIDS